LTVNDQFAIRHAYNFLQIKPFRKKKTGYYIYQQIMLKQCIIGRKGRSSPGRVIAMTVLLFIAAQPVFSQTSYIKKYQPLADSLADEYEIPVAIILGVAIVESGSGTSRNSKLLNNHFGIIGKNDLLKTKGIYTRYKQFPDVHSSYVAFCKLVKKKKYYNKLKGNSDFTKWLEEMSKSGYTEAPEEWKKRIASVIRKHKLSATHQTNL
jgi:Bax protein